MNLKKTIGIPVTPEKWEFESKKDWKVFTLLFEPIPIKNYTINIIESLEPDGNFSIILISPFPWRTG